MWKGCDFLAEIGYYLGQIMKNYASRIMSVINKFTSDYWDAAMFAIRWMNFRGMGFTLEGGGSSLVYQK